MKIESYHKIMEYSKIKIVIWDLDDTFWKGTLSEGDIIPIPDNINLVKRLTDCGIVNSICSKNDMDPTMKMIESIDPELPGYFVLPSIDWTPKSKRIQNLLKTLGLREQNCLFIDDNIHNIEDVRFLCPDIMTALPQELPELIEASKNADPKDKSHKRLKQYKILETKAKAAKEYEDNTDFLISSDIKVEINRDCLPQIDRICELITRSNQLNFTKKRDSKEQVRELIEDPSCDTGYVTVTDNFGDYGMVGFFAVKHNKCIHFLFSCRTIGQGVEEYVYAVLGHPELQTVEPVINHLERGKPAPTWINQKNGAEKKHVSAKTGKKVVFKGACDLSQMCEYLDTNSICEEFTYIGKKRNNFIEHHNHSVNYLAWRKLTADEKNTLVGQLVFNDEEMFDTSIFDDDVALVILSTMIEPHMGIYRNRKTGFRIAFGENAYPLTDPESWPMYLGGKLSQSSKFITEEWLKNFAEEYEFCGALTPDEIIDNAKVCLSSISPKAKLCFVLGPELRYENETNPTYFGREKIYKEVNDKLRVLSQQEPRVLLIDVNEWVTRQSDFTNNINHWKRSVYYKMAERANQYIQQICDEKITQRSRLYLIIRNIIDTVGNIGGLRNTSLWLKIGEYRAKRKRR